MIKLARYWKAPALLGVALALGVGLTVRAGSPVRAETPHVLVMDNDASTMGADPGAADWGFGPTQIVVSQGQSVVFENPAGNHYPHTVTSISFTGRFPDASTSLGAKFNSSVDFASAIRPGGSWTLDTTDIAPGHYAYYCWIHPWMVGSLTVTE